MPAMSRSVRFSSQHHERVDDQPWGSGLANDVEVEHLRKALLAAQEREKRLQSELECMEQAKVLDTKLRAVAVEGRMDAERRLEELQRKMLAPVARRTPVNGGAVEPSSRSQSVSTHQDAALRSSGISSKEERLVSQPSTSPQENAQSKATLDEDLEHEMFALRHQIDIYEHDFAAEHQQLENLQAENERLRQMAEVARRECKRFREQVSRIEADVAAERQARLDLVRWVRRHRHELRTDVAANHSKPSSSSFSSCPTPDIDWEDLVPRDGSGRYPSAVLQSRYQVVPAAEA